MRFDIDAYVEHCGRLDTSDLDLPAGFAGRPLDPDAIRCLRYMHDIEHHTVCYLRDLLVTRAHADPEITTFLTMWNFEEHWHGEVLGRILACHGEEWGADRVARVRAETPPRAKLRPLLFMLGSALFSDLIAVQMTWGAINEWTTQTGYGQLAAKARHPVLTEVLRRIMRQEGRHIDFYVAEARRRLAASPRARRVTRMALRRYWTPVGSGVRPPGEVEFVVRYLFSDPAGRAAAARIQRNIDRLPGLDGLSLIDRALARFSDSAAAGVAA